MWRKVSRMAGPAHSAPRTAHRALRTPHSLASSSMAVEFARFTTNIGTRHTRWLVLAVPSAEKEWLVFGDAQSRERRPLTPGPRVPPPPPPNAAPPPPRGLVPAVPSAEKEGLVFVDATSRERRRLTPVP